MVAKRIILMRHAKSSWDSAVARDFDRPLNDRGHTAGVAMGRYLKAQGIGWDVLLVSPAVRTRQTVQRLEVGYGETLAPLYDDRLYMASATQLLTVVRGLDDGADTALLLAHNPGVQGLALTLTPQGEVALKRARIASKYPTGAIAVIDLPITRWQAAVPAGGQLTAFVKPKDLKNADRA